MAKETSKVLQLHTLFHTDNGFKGSQKKQDALISTHNMVRPSIIQTEPEMKRAQKKMVEKIIEEKEKPDEVKDEETVPQSDEASGEERPVASEKPKTPPRKLGFHRNEE